MHKCLKAASPLVWVGTKITFRLGDYQPTNSSSYVCVLICFNEEVKLTESCVLSCQGLEFN